jgi:eukaryotic-like serine/threonine-protein kinase
MTGEQSEKPVAGMLRAPDPAATSSDLDRDPVEQLAEEFLERRRQGENVSVAEYAERHPHLAERIGDLFPTLLLMEELKPAALASHAGGGVLLGHAADWHSAPEQLGDFRILREIGRGGMGVVYEAEQESLGRHVALKVLPPVRIGSPGRLRRFLREAQAAARLHHTNIVPIFGVGEQDGLRYYVMQFIPGQGLDRVLAAMQTEGTSPQTMACGEVTYWRSVARIGVQVAEALEYAHRQGVLHRDIKPANLLLDNRGTTWIADFGLAKLVELDDLTHSGDTVGTLRYMAPERFFGKADARSDVYSLGLTLYELLTRRPAFDETDRGSLIRQVTQEEPPRPRKLDAAIPRDLETIVVKAIASQADRRYQTAGELAADLRCYLEDRPVRARRASLADRTWRWCRRNRAVAALTGAALALLISVAVVASVGYLSTNRALKRVSEERELAEIAREQEEIAREQAEGARQQAEAARMRTRAERERAEANLRLATKAFEDIFSKVASETVSPPSEQEEDEEWPEPAWETVVTDKDAAMLESMLKFYDQFAQQNHADVKLQKETARAYRRVGDIQRRLGQYAKAETAYRHALAMHQRLVDASAENADSLTAIAAIHNDLGIIFRATGRMAEASTAHRQAKETLDKEPPQTAALPESRFELAKTCSYLSTSQPGRGPGGPSSPGGPLGGPGGLRPGRPRQGWNQEAVENNRRALEILAKLTAEAPENPRYRLATARCQRDRYVILALGGRRDEAEQARKDAVAILEELISAVPGNPDYRYELAETYVMGFSRSWDGKAPDGVREQLQRAVEIAGDLVARYPTVPEYKSVLARSYVRLAEITRSGSAAAEAEGYWTKAVELQRKLAAEFASVDAYRSSLVRSLHQLAEIQAARHELPQARANLEEAIATSQNLRQPAGGMRPPHMMLAAEYSALAKVLRELGETTLADEAAAKAAEAGRRHGRPGAGPIRREGEKSGKSK